MTIEIKPKVGLNDLQFGVSMKDVEKFLGKPEEIAKIDEMDEYKSTVWHYWDHGFSLFFDESSTGKLLVTPPSTSSFPSITATSEMKN